MIWANNVLPRFIGVSGEGNPGRLPHRHFAVQIGDTRKTSECRASSWFPAHGGRFNRTLLAQNNWTPFTRISLTDAIASFLLSKSEADFITFLDQQRLLTNQRRREQLLPELRNISNVWNNGPSSLLSVRPETLEQDLLRAHDFWTSQLPQFVELLRSAFEQSFTKLFQILGDNIRRSGNPFSQNNEPKRFYDIPERVIGLISLIREYNRRKDQPSFIVLDALRNPFETLFFRDRFASFYLFAVNTENTDREARLQWSQYNAKQIHELDAKEYPSRSKPLAGYEQFVSQDIQSCIEKADVFIHNPGHPKQGQSNDVRELRSQLVKYVSLIQHPGLVTPSRTERCMQIAFSARANSGCISRQVGAVVTDEHYSVKAVGWNDVPFGQVPCLLRRAEDILEKTDDAAFSQYEFRNSDFEGQLKKSFSKFKSAPMKGRLSAFCFKQQYNALKNEENQVHTRSLHAEENAFMQIAKFGGGPLIGGILFSTASPCELCSKKAYQLGIKEIYYIDPYPGIAVDHILASGIAEQRPQLHLFRGAIGHAYHKLYDPILPYKDEIGALMKGAQSISSMLDSSGSNSDPDLFQKFPTSSTRDA